MPKLLIIFPTIEEKNIFKSSFLWERFIIKKTEYLNIIPLLQKIGTGLRT